MGKPVHSRYRFRATEAYPARSPGCRVTGTHDGSTIQGDVTDGQCGLHFTLRRGWDLTIFRMAGDFRQSVQSLWKPTARRATIRPCQIETEATATSSAPRRRRARHPRVLAGTSEDRRNTALRMMATSLRDHRVEILTANAADLAAFKGSNAFRDRLTLNDARVEAMANGLEDVAALPDPLGRVLADWTRPNGLRIQRIATPIGVIGMIYESRPNVGADASALCLKSGNAVILRGGSDSLNSARAINPALVTGLEAAGLPPRLHPGAAQRGPGLCRGDAGGRGADRPDHSARRQIAGRARAARGARAGSGPCRGALPHLHPCRRRSGHGASDRRQRQDAPHRRLRRHRDAADRPFHRRRAIAADRRRPSRAGLRFPRRRGARGRSCRTCRPRTIPISIPNGWTRCISVGVVDGLDAALAHIARHGSSHTDAIVTEDAAAAERFLAGVDSAVALWNASTQFCDGGEFGFGAEIGIATGRIHARGPVGLEQLTIYRYTIRGNGQVRA